jgi:NAD(P)H-nitrite reductase large subunit
MNYVIIGACAAGLSTAEAIRKADAKGNITMLTEEAYLPYSRPSISYFLKGKVKESDMALRKPAFYKANNINVVTDAKVTSIDRKIKPLKSAKNHTLMINFALQQVQSLLFRQWKMLTVRIMQ